jgi:hypothetical protein
MNNQSFEAYYTKHILNNEIGFKPVRGATGLGKTYGLIQAVKESIAQGSNKKFVYITNRHALIKEVEKDFFENARISPIYLKNDKQILLDLIKEQKLQAVINSLIDKDFFKYDNHNLHNKSNDLLKIYFSKLISNIDKVETFLDIDKDNDEGETSYLDTLLLRLAKEIKRQFYRIKDNAPTKYKHFLKDTDIWQLFPYIQFEHDENAKVLLGTIQKFCYGFYDGKKKQKITALKDKVIFLDEFDFLENEILNILCQETPLNNPLEFVKIFYDRFQILIDKSFWNKEGVEDVKEKLNLIFNDLAQKIQSNKYHFPQLTDFIFSDKFKKDKDLILFQTNQTISDYFFLTQKKYAWEITNRKYKEAIKPNDFFKMIRGAVISILDALSFSMEQNGDITKSIIQRIWNTKNDNQEGAYHKYIEDILVYKAGQSNISNQALNDFNYKQGFSLIKIIHNPDKLDDLDANLQQIELNISPEAIIQQLAGKNLVFALSATSDIPRMVRCFSEKWLKSNTNFIHPDKEDLKLLAEIKREKDGKRKSKVVFAPNLPLENTNLIASFLDKLEKTHFYSDSDTSTQGIQYRKERLSKFLGCIDWILNQSKNRSHLVFLDTFNHCLKFIQGEYGEMPSKLTEIWQVENLEKGMGYKLVWNSKTCNIIFLNSSKAKEIEENPEDAYNKIMADTSVDKVILVTQYATASNGVNLGFTDENNTKRDFEGVHLLEGKYYWFDTPEEMHYKDVSKQKQIYWYLWKLKDNNWDGGITSSKLKYFLKLQNFNVNSFYQNKTAEYILNSMALFHQAIGRVERQRQYEQPLVEITLGRDVLEVFRDFGKEDIQTMPEIVKRELYTATTISQLYKEVDTYIAREKFSIPNPQSISNEQNRGKEIINRILDEITKIKKGEYSKDETQVKIAKELIQIWKKIRIEVLQQNYDAEIKVESKEVKRILRISSNELIFKHHFSYESNYIHEGGIIYMTPSELEIYKDDKRVIVEDLERVDLNSPFKIIKENAVIRSYFEDKNYELSYIDSLKMPKLAFTPNVEQSILKGAIGEEALTALLEHSDIHCQDLDEIDIRIFEVADAKIKGLPIYIDFKNFSENTIHSYHLRNDDLDYNPKTDAKSLAQKIAGKLRHIQKITKEENAKFILLNLALPSDHRKQYFKLKPKSVEETHDFATADIIIIPHAILKNTPNVLSSDFKAFVRYIKRELKAQS